MALQYSVDVRNAQLDAIETTIGVSAQLRVYTGSPPSNCASAATGTLLATATLPTDWMATASAGVKSLTGSWSDPIIETTGTAGYFRMYDSTGTTCHMQGDITDTLGSGVMKLDNTSMESGGTFVVSSFTLTAGNS